MRIGAAYFPVTLSYASYFIIHRLGHVSVGRRAQTRVVGFVNFKKTRAAGGGWSVGRDPT